MEDRSKASFGARFNFVLRIPEKLDAFTDAYASSGCLHLGKLMGLETQEKAWLMETLAAFSEAPSSVPAATLGSSQLLNRTSGHPNSMTPHTCTQTHNAHK